MPQRVSKVIDHRRPSPTVRRDENMQLQNPNLRLHDGQWVNFTNSDRMNPPRTFRSGREEGISRLLSPPCAKIISRVDLAY